MICLFQAIVDRNPAVSSAALVSSIHLMKKAGDVSFFFKISSFLLMLNS